MMIMRTPRVFVNNEYSYRDNENETLQIRNSLAKFSPKATSAADALHSPTVTPSNDTLAYYNPA